MEVGTISTISTRKTDKERAEEFKVEVRVVLDQATEILSRAASEGIIINFTIQRDGFGRSFVGSLTAHRDL